MRLTSTPEQVQAAFDATANDPAWSASRRLIAQGKSPSEMFQTLALRPDILAAMQGLGASVYPGGLLERPLKEWVVLEVSRMNECQYCAASHTGTMQRLGIEASPTGGLTQRERLALAYTRTALADSNRVPDALFAEIQSAFSDGEIVELTFLIGLTGLLNLFNNCLQVRYHDDYAFGDLAEPVQ